MVAFVGIQLVPTALNKSEVDLTTDISEIENTSENIQILLSESCYDCHSNNTNYPWYIKIQPVAWFLEDHIKVGKAELNFNEWATYSSRRKRSKLKSIISQVEKDEMPLSSYTLIHREAKLTKSDKELIVRWANQRLDSINNN